MPHPLSDLTQALLDAARKAGADTADAIAIRGTSVTVDVRAGALEQAERSEATDIGLRVLLGRRQANVIPAAGRCQASGRPMSSRRRALWLRSSQSRGTSRGSECHVAAGQSRQRGAWR